jgi:hypothetical protein
MDLVKKMHFNQLEILLCETIVLLVENSLGVFLCMRLRHEAGQYRANLGERLFARLLVG